MPVDQSAAIEVTAFEWVPDFAKGQVRDMLLNHAKWATFTTRPICPQGSSEVALAINFDDRETVDGLCTAAASAGGMADPNPPADHGFMYQRSIADPDGHIWEPFWMDPAAYSAPAHLEEENA